MSNDITSVLTPIRDFLLPFFILAAAVYILMHVIRRFDFFRITSKFFGQLIELEAGSYPNPNLKRHDNSPSDAESRTLSNNPAPPQLLTDVQTDSKNSPDL
jgi:hypothetical protein